MRPLSRLVFSVLLGLLLYAVGPVDLAAQSLPPQVRVELERAGHEELAEDLADRMGPRSTVDPDDVEELLERWEQVSGGPRTALVWLTAARLWLRAGDAEAAGEALDRAEAAGAPAGLVELDRARIGFLAGETEAAAEHYWLACSSANEASALEAWRDVEMLATPDEVEQWDRFRRLPASQRDDCGFFRAFWNERAARSAMSVADRIETHYARLRIAMDHYTRRGRAQDVGASGKLNARLGRTGAPRFDDRGLLYLRLGPPDETASTAGGECNEPNVTWFYRFPDENRMYHLSPLGGTDNWWLLSNLGEIFRCPVRADGTIDRSRNPMVALPPILDDIPAGVMAQIYGSRAQLDPRYARFAHQFSRRAVEILRDERDLTWADGQYAVTEVPERPDVRMDVGLLHEWVAFRLPMPDRTRMWLFLAVNGDELQEIEPRPEEGLEVVVTALDRDGHQERTTGRLEVPSDPGSDVVVRLPFDLPPGEYETKVVVRAAPPRAPGDDRGPPSGGFTSGTLSVPEMSAPLPRLSGIAVSPDSGGSWAQTDAVALSPQPIHVTNADGRIWIYFEAYNLTPGGRYTADVLLEPEDGDGPPFDLEFTGVARSAGRVVTPSGLRLDLAEAPPGLYRLTLTVRDLGTGRVTLPSRTEIRVLERDESQMADATGD